jgi:hypothetical protein
MPYYFFNKRSEITKQESSELRMLLKSIAFTNFKLIKIKLTLAGHLCNLPKDKNAGT